jgi:opacity protein-like surface antigen
MMKLITKAALASLALGAPAQAADLFGAAPPASFPSSQAPTAIEIGSNWYLRGDVGASFHDGPTASLDPTLAIQAGVPGVPLGAATWGGASWANFTGGLGFGYRFSDYLRLDATWDLSTGPGVNRSASFASGSAAIAAMMGISVPVLCNGAFGLRPYANTFLANGYVDLGHWSGVTPYLGGGVGLGVNAVQASLDYSLHVVVPPGPPIAPWSSAIHATADGFAWALMAGFSWQLTPSVAIDFGYRYLNGGSTRTFVNPQTGTILRQSNVSQQVRVGLRYLIQ